MIISAGLVIIMDNKVLLLKPVGTPDTGHYSFPKGKVEENEDLVEAALRETYEEVGLVFTKSDILSEGICVRYVNKGLETKRVYCFIVRVEEGRVPLRIPNSQIQSDEVEHARFYSRADALLLLFWRYRHIVLKELKP